MWTDLFRTVDRVLRGGFTRRDELASGRVEAPAPVILTASLVLGSVYGACMGLFALFHPARTGIDQLVASTVKVPLLFLLTLLVTFPSLYVVSALFDSRLRFRETLRLLVLAILVDLALLASFGPVTGFFTLSTDSYPFMVLLNVAFFAISGLVGLAFLRRALDGVFGAAPADPTPASDPPAAGPEAAPAAARRAGREPAGAAAPPRRIFAVWIVIYAVVGAQMGWILRPFIGNPAIEFQFFRPRGSNFFEAVAAAIQQLLR